MTLHPEIFSEAQAEIDTVVGRDRLPELSDREKLPFLECVLKEVYRWNPPAPIAAAHRLMQDDFYEGYLIPKGRALTTGSRCTIMDDLDRDYRYSERLGNDPRSSRLPRSNDV